MCALRAQSTIELDPDTIVSQVTPLSKGCSTCSILSSSSRVWVAGGHVSTKTSWTRHQVVCIVFKEIVQLNFIARKLPPTGSVSILTWIQCSGSFLACELTYYLLRPRVYYSVVCVLDPSMLVVTLIPWLPPKKAVFDCLIQFWSQSQTLLHGTDYPLKD